MAELIADGVFSGGGIKGLAFAGALEGAAEAGYSRWHGLAGTSAGAITAMALAVGHDASSLRATLDAFDFGKIADYGSPIHLLGAARNLVLHDAVVEGDALTDWIRSLLDGAPLAGVTADLTFGELRRLREGAELIVIGSDIAHARMVEFPTDAGSYLEARTREPIVPDDFPVARAVRISASYPYFFPPVGGLLDSRTRNEAVFVDGGVASAMPLFVFDRRSPAHPTWGFHLHGGLTASESDVPHHPIGGIGWPVQMLEGILDTAMNALDSFEERRFAKRVVAIPTGGVSTLNFNLGDREKAYLYESGLTAARAFFASGPTGENSFGERPPAQAVGG
ncbi:MAG TPA: patatin-like phospholipase family protein [Solirubrobacteraceae bacterium]|nr:patatin-like phospholipase family protein [Solirubrobacteraceae bacterium]